MTQKTAVLDPELRSVSPLLTYTEAGSYLRKGTTFVRERVHAGELTIVRIGRTPYIHRDELDRFISAAPTETGRKAQRARYNRKSA